MNKGFTLIEALVASVILGILFLVLSTATLHSDWENHCSITASEVNGDLRFTMTGNCDDDDIEDFFEEMGYDD